MYGNLLGIKTHSRECYGRDGRKTCYNDDRSIDQEHAQNVLNIGRVVRMHEDLHYPKINVATVSLNTAI